MELLFYILSKLFRDVPLSLFVGLSVVAIAYVGASSSLTLMVPFYNISSSSPYPEAFQHYGWEWTRSVMILHLERADMAWRRYVKFYIVRVDL